MKAHFLFLSLLCLSLFISCQSGTETDKGADDTELELNAAGLPVADLGITVVNPDGWSEDQMSFQQNYCLTMFEKLDADYDPVLFCECFLAKVQYYYKPVYIFEAYEDQKTWNSFCLKSAGLEQ